jgi:DNA-binding transcriptional LysR family regulator
MLSQAGGRTMYQKDESELVPSHLYRAVVAIVDAGSMTKAGQMLGLSQAAVSQQISRLEEILGGPVFDKSGAGLKLTERGDVVLDYARRFLTMNEQLLAYAGPHPLPRQFSIGMPKWLRHAKLVEILKTCATGPDGKSTGFYCNDMPAVKRDLAARKLDLAFLCEVTHPPGTPVVEWTESLCWVAAPGLRLPSGAPIPLVSWFGSLTDRYAVKAFEATGVRFSITFWSSDATSRVAAAEAGLGYTLINSRSVTPGLDIVSEPFLPETPQIKTGIYVRAGLDQERYEPLIRTFQKAMAPPAMTSERHYTTLLSRPKQPHSA